MKVRHSTAPLPRSFAGHSAAAGLLGEHDIAVRRTGRLRAKLLVFKHPAALRGFWRDALHKSDLGRGCLGAVTAMGHEVIDTRTDESTLVVDPRYFCLIGLTKANLSMEIICHESGHAGFCYAKRVKRDLWVDAGMLDEENVCYPAGRISAAINRYLHAAGLYQ